MGCVLGPGADKQKGIMHAIFAGTELEDGFDPSVYSTRRQFRMLGCAKRLPGDKGFSRALEAVDAETYEFLPLSKDLWLAHTILGGLGLKKGPKLELSPALQEAANALHVETVSRKRPRRRLVR